MPDQPTIPTLGLLFFRGTGAFAWLERVGCRYTAQPLAMVPAHVAVRIGDVAYEAVATGVQRGDYLVASTRPDLLMELVLPVRTAKQIAAARAYAEKCVADGEAYSWRDIRLTIWAWAAPWIVTKFPNRFKSSSKGTICSLFAMLVLSAAGCPLAKFFSPATTPNELMVRGEDYVAALTPVDVDSAATACACSESDSTATAEKEILQ